MSDLDHAADAMAYTIMSGFAELVPTRRKLLDWLVPPTLYCFMVLFVTLTLYEVMSKFVDGMAAISQGILVQ
jgi:hypothetical protein